MVGQDDAFSLRVKLNRRVQRRCAPLVLDIAEGAVHEPLLLRGYLG